MTFNEKYFIKTKEKKKDFYLLKNVIDYVSILREQNLINNKEEQILIGHSYSIFLENVIERDLSEAFEPKWSLFKKEEDEKEFAIW